MILTQWYRKPANNKRPLMHCVTKGSLSCEVDRLSTRCFYLIYGYCNAFMCVNKKGAGKSPSVCAAARLVTGAWTRDHVTTQILHICNLGIHFKTFRTSFHRSTEALLFLAFFRVIRSEFHDHVACLLIRKVMAFPGLCSLLASSTVAIAVKKSVVILFIAFIAEMFVWWLEILSIL